MRHLRWDRIAIAAITLAVDVLLVLGALKLWHLANGG